MKNLIVGLLSFAHNVKPKFQLSTEARNCSDKSPTRKSNRLLLLDRFTHCGSDTHGNTGSEAHQEKDKNVPTIVAHDEKSSCTVSSQRVCKLPEIFIIQNSNQASEADLNSSGYKDSGIENDAANIGTNDKIVQENLKNKIPFVNMQEHNTNIYETCKTSPTLESGTPNRGHKVNSAADNFNVNSHQNALAQLNVTRDDMCSCCFPEFKNIFGDNSQYNTSCKCSNESIYSQGNEDVSNNVSGTSTFTRSPTPPLISSRKCFEERETRQTPIKFSEKCYVGSEEYVSEICEDKELSHDWNSNEDKENEKNIQFRQRKPNNLLSTLWKSRNSYSFESPKIINRNDSIISFNLSSNSERLSQISSDLSLWKMFKEGVEQENSSDTEQSHAEDELQDNEGVVYSGLFDVIEEDIPDRKEQFTRSNSYLWQKLSRTTSSYELETSDQGSFRRVKKKLNNRTRLRTTSEKLQPLPELSPYFTGGRLGPSNRSYMAPTWRLWGEEKVEGAVYTVYLKKVRYHHPSRSIVQETDDDDISHLEWETVRVWFLKAGSLEKLVESLSSTETGELESTFVNVFLATYRTFATSAQVLNLILERYLALLDTNNNEINVPDHLREEHQKALRLTLQVWLDTYPGDFNCPPLYSGLQQLKQFSSEHLKGSDLDVKVHYKHEKMEREEKERESSVSGVVSCDDIMLHCSDDMSHLPPSPLLPQPYPTLISVPGNVFANQLTRMDMILFRRVIAHQCLGSIWGKRDRVAKNNKGTSRGGEAATVTATVEQFNAVSFRVQSTVLLNTDLKPTDRAKLLQKWIDIAQELRILKNFSSLKAIIAGLQSNPIYRLKKSWAAVPREKCEVYEELARIFSEENNRLNQRELLMREGTAKHAQTAHASDRHLPKAIEKHANNPLAVNHGTIPYLGTFLTDLMMIDTAIPDTVQNGLINFDKKRKEFEVLAQIRLLQGAAAAYQLEPDSQFEQWWEAVLVLDDKESWRLSCLIEPYEPANQAANAARENKIKKRAAQLGHRKNDSLASTSSGSSSSQFFLDTDSINNQTQDSPAQNMTRKMSTSSTNSSQPSLDASLHSTATTASATTLDRHSANTSIHQHDDNNTSNNPSLVHNSLSNTSITSNNSNTSLSNTSLSNTHNSYSNSSSGHVSLNATSSSKSNISNTSNGGSNNVVSNPYITPEFYIIKVSLENNSQESDGVNLYKSVLVSNSERTASVVRAAMEKHGIEEESVDDYTLAQLLPHGEMILQSSANVYYAISTVHDLNFILRRRRHGDENTILRRHPDKDTKTRKKIPS